MKIKKRILITGGRSPVALEWVRRLAQADCTVVAADTTFLTLTRFSRYITAYERYVPPRTNSHQFNKDLLAICSKHKIELIIPTCEESFWIAGKTIGSASVYYPGRETARKLHDKLHVARLCQKLDIPTPETWIHQNLPTRDGIWIIKPRFTRSGINIRMMNGVLDRKAISSDAIIQTKIEGDQLCFFGIANRGELLAAVCYRPVIRLKKNKGGIKGPAVAFETFHHAELVSYARRIIKNTAYTGMLGVDAILQKNGIPSIHDINPRTTSGIHLLGTEFDIELFLRGKKCHQPIKNGITAWIPLAACFGDTSIRDIYLKRTNNIWIDVITTRQDPLPTLGQLATLFHLFQSGLKFRCSPLAATTTDIEWNGEYER